MMLLDRLPHAWRAPLEAELSRDEVDRIDDFLAIEEASGYTVYPPGALRFAALEAVEPKNVKAVILGQDPYHDDGQAHGLAFSVPIGVKVPPSLRNIFKELASDVGCAIPEHGYLQHWANQGVLLLNTVLTVRAHAAGSHRNRGWEIFTDAVVRIAAAQQEAKAFVLWGAYAQEKMALIDTTRDLVLSAPHPSPLSAHRGFFGSRPFSQINDFLAKNGRDKINWEFPTQQLTMEF